MTLSYVRPVADGDPVVPEPTTAAAGNDVATVEAWAEPWKAVLADLTLVLLAAEARADAAERDLAHEQAGGAAEGPTGLLVANLDAMLATSMARLDAGVTMAHSEAAAVVRAATQEATDLLRSLGADATKVFAQTVPRPQLVPLLRRPRSAIKLKWEVEPRQLPPTRTASRPPAPGWLGQPRQPTSSLGPDVALWEPGRVNDLFWRAARGTGPARQLLQRLARADH